MAALRSVLALARPCVARSLGGVRRMADEAVVEQRDTLTLTFGSPGEAYYNGVEVASVDAVTMAGHVGLAPNHVPTLAALIPGILTVKEGEGKDVKFFVSSGGLTVNSDSSVQILAEEAVPLDQLDAAAIRTGLDGARSQLQSARTDKDTAEAEIAISAWEALSEAASQA